MAFTSPNMLSTGLSSAVTTYLNKWLQISSGNRVKFRYGRTNPGTLVFECYACGDIYYECVSNFDGTGSGIPHGLIVFTKNHRHICLKYINTPGGTCAMCGWPCGAHDKEEWLGEVTQPYAEGPEKYVPALKTPTLLKTYTGRKFRDNREF